MRMTIESFKDSLNSAQHTFAETLEFISEHYIFTPTAYKNHDIENQADENQGSCRVIAFALLEGMTTKEALLAFGEHSREVVNDPEGNGHANIRALMAHGIDDVTFEEFPLEIKEDR